MRHTYQTFMMSGTPVIEVFGGTRNGESFARWVIDSLGKLKRPVGDPTRKDVKRLVALKTGDRIMVIRGARYQDYNMVYHVEGQVVTALRDGQVIGREFSGWVPTEAIPESVKKGMAIPYNEDGNYFVSTKEELPASIEALKEEARQTHDRMDRERRRALQAKIRAQLDEMTRQNSTQNQDKLIELLNELNSGDDQQGATA